MKNIYLLIASTCILSSCTTTRQATIKTQNISQTRVTQHPMLVDLDIAEAKVSAQASGSSTSIATVKNQAVWNAIDQANADVLVEPQYAMETTGSTVTVTVKGWPATYKNFRNMTPADSTVMSFPHAREVNVVSPGIGSESTKRKGGAGGVIGIIVLVGTLALFL